MKEVKNNIKEAMQWSVENDAIFGFPIDEVETCFIIAHLQFKNYLINKSTEVECLNEYKKHHDNNISLTKSMASSLFLKLQEITKLIDVYENNKTDFNLQNIVRSFNRMSEKLKKVGTVP